MSELGVTNDDLYNILAASDDALVLVGMDLKIRRFTAAAGRLLDLLPADHGREVGSLDKHVEDFAFARRTAQVIASLSCDVATARGPQQRWHAVRITPYRTLDHVIRGAVITFRDVDLQTTLQQVAADVAPHAERIFAAVGSPLALVDGGLQLVWRNEAFARLLGIQAPQVDLKTTALVAETAFNHDVTHILKHTLMSREPFFDLRLARTADHADSTIALDGSCFACLDPDALFVLLTASETPRAQK